MTSIFDPFAAREHEDAVEYYEAQEAGLGERFRRAVSEALSIVERNPATGDEVRRGIRKILLRRFPYKLINSEVGEGLHVIAVAHGHREPEYWLGRS